MNGTRWHPSGGNSVVKESFTTGAGGNRQGFLDSSNRWRFDEHRRSAEALEADREDVKQLAGVRKQMVGYLKELGI